MNSPLRHRPLRALKPLFASHDTVNHEAGEYVRGEIHTNTIEGFFSILKRGIVGTLSFALARDLTTRAATSVSSLIECTAANVTSRPTATLTVSENGSTGYMSLLQRAGSSFVAVLVGHEGERAKEPQAFLYNVDVQSFYWSPVDDDGTPSTALRAGWVK